MKHSDLEGKVLPCTAYIAGLDGSHPQKIRILRYDLAAPGCSIKTVLGELCARRQDNYGRRFRIAIESVYLTEDPLWDEMLRDFQGTIDNCNINITATEQLREETKEKLEALQAFLSIRRKGGSQENQVLPEGRPLA